MPFPLSLRLAAVAIVALAAAFGLGFVVGDASDGGEAPSPNNSTERNVHGFGDAPKCWPYGCGDTRQERMRSDDQMMECEQNDSQRCPWEDTPTPTP